MSKISIAELLNCELPFKVIKLMYCVYMCTVYASCIPIKIRTAVIWFFVVKLWSVANFFLVLFLLELSGKVLLCSYVIFEKFYTIVPPACSCDILLVEMCTKLRVSSYTEVWWATVAKRISCRGYYLETMCTSYRGPGYYHSVHSCLATVSLPLLLITYGREVYSRTPL